MSVIRDIQDRLFWRQELKARQRINTAAFANGRFVLNLHMRGECALVSFTPREDEAPQFFRNYVAPIGLGYQGAFIHNSWDWLGNISHKAVAYWAKIRRWSDVARVEVLAPDEAYRDRLIVALDQAIKDVAAHAKTTAVNADEIKKDSFAAEGAPGQFRKRPVVIDAWRLTLDSLVPLPGWVADALAKWPGVGGLKFKLDSPDGDCLRIATLEGMMTAQLGDWIIRGVKGELYPCKPDIFEMTYDLVEPVLDNLMICEGCGEHLLATYIPKIPCTHRLCYGCGPRCPICKKASGDFVK